MYGFGRTIHRVLELRRESEMFAETIQGLRVYGLSDVLFHTAPHPN